MSDNAKIRFGGRIILALKECDQRIAELEKKVAALEAQIQELPKKNQIFSNNLANELKQMIKKMNLTSCDSTVKSER